MAQIAEDLFLLLLDNASAQPALERDRRERLLAAAVLLDLAYACRIRPAVPGDATQAGLHRDCVPELHPRVEATRTGAAGFTQSGSSDQ